MNNGRIAMRERVKWASLAAICALLVLSAFSSACARSMITARIIDAESGEPVNEAIVAYWWYREKLIMPGMPTKIVTIDAGEEISGDDGSVELPKHSTLLYNLDMVAYKKGYVCWSNRRLFPTWEQRKDFKLEHGMVILIEPFKQEYSKRRHADFVSQETTGFPEGPRLGEAVTKELQVLIGK